jgi:hypothetical protein
VEKQRLRATGLVAAGVVAGGILAGTLAAQAADDTNDRAEVAPGGTIMRAHHDGPGGPRGGEDLAKALGVSQEKLRSAFEAIHDDVKPTDRRADGPPTAAERTARHEKVTDALAEELGLSEAKVEAAFAKVHKVHAAERREALSDRLDAAVEDGKLTKDDKTSVLKAFDAGVLGGPGGRGRR